MAVLAFDLAASDQAAELRGAVRALPVSRFVVALALCLAESTVKSHLASLFRKLGAGSRKEVARLALDPDEGLSHLVARDGGVTLGEASLRATV